MIEFRSDQSFKLATVQALLQQKSKEDVQYYSYSNKDYWAFVSANEKTQLQKEGKLPANYDHDDVPGGDFDSSSYHSADEDQPNKKFVKVELPAKVVGSPNSAPSPRLPV
jgi:hypothetical protein